MADLSCCGKSSAWVRQRRNMYYRHIAESIIHCMQFKYLWKSDFRLWQRPGPTKTLIRPLQPWRWGQYTQPKHLHTLKSTRHYNSNRHELQSVTQPTCHFANVIISSWQIHNLLHTHTYLFELSTTFVLLMTSNLMGDGNEEKGVVKSPSTLILPLSDTASEIKRRAWFQNTLVYFRLS